MLKYRSTIQPIEFTTDRLLRQWQNYDLAPFALLNADPIVMAFFFPTRLGQTTSDAMAKHCKT